jgi:hypothetical protein
VIKSQAKLPRVQGAAEKIKRETDAHLRQLAKTSTYLFSGRFSTRGVRKHGKKIEYVSTTAGEIFFRAIFLTFYTSDFFVFALVERLSVRGTQIRDKQCFTGSCVYFLSVSPCRFFFAFWGVSRQGEIKNAIKKITNRTSKKNPGQI